MPYFGNDPTDTIIQNVAGGKVLQTVFAEATGSGTQISFTTKDTYNVNLTANITCASTANKVFLTGTQCLAVDTDNRYVNGSFFRDTTNLGDGRWGLGGGPVDVGGFNSATWGGSYLDSPSSTSQITYKMSATMTNTGATAYINVNDAHAAFVLMEIEG
jgi:hypothetical protein